MLNKLHGFLRRYEMVKPGDHVVCAVSGGADSMALLWGMVLLQEKLGITVSAAHFNHHLRGEESCRDASFVRDFCAFHEIPFVCGEGRITAGQKGLEAAARDARYAFFDTLPGKIATAHTADDNAETVIMHMIRGTGLRGLGGISPVRGRIIRPMLGITRDEILSFLQENFIPHIEDSSNAGDVFLRNRIRHRVVPILKEENPALAENLSRMALRLRQDEAYLSEASQCGNSVNALRQMHPSLRSRALERILRENGVKEPEASHLHLAEQIVFSPKPSARVKLPGGVTIGRVYDRITAIPETETIPETVLTPGASIDLPGQNLRIVCTPAETLSWNYGCITVCPEGKLILRSRRPGDTLRLDGGTKSLQKLMIDRKIPASFRDAVPVIADDTGVVAVYGIGGNLNKKANTLPAVEIRFLPRKEDRNQSSDGG